MTSAQRSAGASFTFVTLVSATLVVTILARAQPVVVPIALAVLLAFVLSPVVTAFQQVGLRRGVAAVLVLMLALATVAGLGWTVGRQLQDLAANIPEYSRELRHKLALLRDHRGALASLQRTVADVSQELAEGEPRPRRDAESSPQAVRLVAEPSDLERLRAILEPVLEPLAQAGIVLVLTGFMLTHREDLRNRFIRLAGRGRMTVTTRALDEAGSLVGRYLLTQSMVNAGFGLVVTGGLMLIGVSYAALWGAVGGLLRFVPYVGAVFGLALPTALAFVQFGGFGNALATAGLFLGLDAITAGVIEPLLVGHRTGVSSVALLASALFWTWLWGPVGLVLATPLTVCLVVMGRQVPQLEFLAVLLGDQPPLEPEVAFYQRLLARDDDEAGAILEQAVGSASADEVLDRMLLPTLVRVEVDHARDEISESEHAFVLAATRAIVEELAAAGGDVVPARRSVVAVPARSGADEIAVAMLGQVVRPLSVRLAGPEETPPGREAGIVCASALPPGGVQRARHLCQWIRRTWPRARIVVLRPVVEGDTGDAERRLVEAGADVVVETLAGWRDEIERGPSSDARAAFDGHHVAGAST